MDQRTVNKLITKVASFDLSTTCTGVSFGEIEGNKLIKLNTEAIKTVNVDPTTLGYQKTRKGFVGFYSYVKNKTEVPTKAEAKRRDIAMHRLNDQSKIKQMYSGISTIVRREHPDIILMEENMAFRNIDITRKLAEIAGILQAIAFAHEAELIKINVNNARAIFNVSRESTLFARTKTVAELKRMDLTKETVKHIMLRELASFGLNPDMTTDESDSLLVLYYYIHQILPQKGTKI